MLKNLKIAATLAIMLAAPLTLAQQASMELNERIVSVTTEFLDTLTRTQHNNAVYDFDDEERLNWHFIPRDRNGVVFRSMTDEQLEAATMLLRTLFSVSGYAQTQAVRDLENVLAEIEINGMFERDPDLYYITVFGEPGMNTTWGLRYEGHHLAFNWTFVDGVGIASSPQFFGSNPAEVRSGSKTGTRVLGAEEDLARELLLSLNAQQQQQAIVAAAVPRDILTGASKEVVALENSGIRYADLNSAQKLNLLRLIEEVASVQADALFEKRMADIRAQGLDDVRFTWIGNSERGAAHYYRVQGAGFLIEYDNSQNNANHVHLVRRDFNGDFGRDLLRLHYDAVASAYGPGHQH